MKTENSDVLLIRADAGVRMGTGHVMRCLGLAQAWQDDGGRVVYVMAAGSPGIEDRLRNENIEVVPLAVEPGSSADALATAKAAAACGAAWIALDGYHFDASYHAVLKRSGLWLLVLDDFGALEHYWADLVLNQDPIAEEGLYVGREASTRLLLGTDYTFLRREFRRCPRPTRQIPPVAGRLLVTLGGSDPDNVTEKVMSALDDVRVDDLETIVLVGPSNPHGDRLQAVLAGCRSTVRLLRNPPDVPGWMAWCDMAVTAGGSTIWELAYFRVPCIVLLTAENQEPAMGLLHRREACLRLGMGGQVARDTLAAAISDLSRDATRREALGQRLGAAVDGQGAARVCGAMRGVL